MKLSRIALAAVAATAFAGAANATVYFNKDVTADLTLAPDGATAILGHTPGAADDFVDTFTFTYDFSGVASASFTNTIQGLRDIDFTGITLNGVAGTFENVGDFSRVYFNNVAFQAGVQTLVITGHSNARLATYGGDLEIQNAVPEPATWAMMVLGIGMVGAAARRRGVKAVAA